MNNYIPFLKLKVNEINALKELALDIKQDGIMPFFDLAKKEDMTSLSFHNSSDSFFSTQYRNDKARNKWAWI